MRQQSQQQQQQQQQPNGWGCPLCIPEWRAAGWWCPLCQHGESHQQQMRKPSVQPERFDITGGDAPEIYDVYGCSWAGAELGAGKHQEEEHQEEEQGSEEKERGTRVPRGVPGYRSGKTQVVPPPLQAEEKEKGLPLGWLVAYPSDWLRCQQTLALHPEEEAVRTAALQPHMQQQLAQVGWSRAELEAVLDAWHYHVPTTVLIEQARMTPRIFREDKCLARGFRSWRKAVAGKETSQELPATSLAKDETSIITDKPSTPPRESRGRQQQLESPPKTQAEKRGARRERRAARRAVEDQGSSTGSGGGPGRQRRGRNEPRQENACGSGSGGGPGSPPTPRGGQQQSWRDQRNQNAAQQQQQQQPRSWVDRMRRPAQKIQKSGAGKEASDSSSDTGEEQRRTRRSQEWLEKPPEVLQRR